MWLLILVALAAPPEQSNFSGLDMKAESNRVREAHQLKPQEMDPRLAAYAQLHAQKMAAHEEMKHSAAGLREIIAWGYTNPQEAFSGWLEDKPHRDSVLGEERYCGFGCAKSNTGRWYWCGIFADTPPERKIEWPGFIESAATDKP